MKALLVSACLLGVCCKYSGGHNALPEAQLTKLRQRYRLVPVCPEQAGGLPTPRVPSERRGEGVFSRDGRDVTAAFQKGAQAALALAQSEGCAMALLKERSPSCGRGEIYDGSFSGRVTPGDGVTAELLLAHGVEVLGESEIGGLLRKHEKEVV